MLAGQPDLFETPINPPPGFRYRQGVIAATEEGLLIRALEKLGFAPFQFHGFLGKRRVVSFGWRYDFNGSGLQESTDIPDFLMPARNAAAAFAKVAPASLQQVLLTEYSLGAAIGWHKDRPIFGDVIGISLLSPCTLRFRKKAGAGWDRRSISLEPGSAYVLQGAARSEWEHSIPPVSALRYSMTFRTLRISAGKDRI